jgi:hypothetical protein
LEDDKFDLSVGLADFSADLVTLWQQRENPPIGGQKRVIWNGEDVKDVAGNEIPIDHPPVKEEDGVEAIVENGQIGVASDPRVSICDWHLVEPGQTCHGPVLSVDRHQIPIRFSRVNSKPVSVKSTLTKYVSVVCNTNICQRISYDQIAKDYV